jgi:hypothetical protein
MGYNANYVSAESMKKPVLSVDEKQKTPSGVCGKSNKDSSSVSSNHKRDEESETEVPVTSPVSIYAIAEMSRRAEESTLKVRSELFRIGCRPSDLSVLRQGVYLQMKYQQQIVLVSPQEVLGILRKIPRGTELSEVWELVFQHAHKLEKQKRLTYGGLAVILLSVLLFVGLLIALRTF